MGSAYLAQGEVESIVKKCAAVYQFDILKKKGDKPVSWTIDLKNGKGSLAKGPATKPDATFTLIDDDFDKMCKGELNPQMAFMEGKMKIKGNIAKATKFTPD